MWASQRTLLASLCVLVVFWFTNVPSPVRCQHHFFIVIVSLYQQPSGTLVPLAGMLSHDHQNHSIRGAVVRGGWSFALASRVVDAHDDVE